MFISGSPIVFHWFDDAHCFSHFNISEIRMFVTTIISTGFLSFSVARMLHLTTEHGIQQHMVIYLFENTLHIYLAGCERDRKRSRIHWFTSPKWSGTSRRLKLGTENTVAWPHYLSHHPCLHGLNEQEARGSSKHTLSQEDTGCVHPQQHLNC